MSNIVTGMVTNGVVVTDPKLPEGTHVEIRLLPVRVSVPPELHEEFDGWERASAGAIEMVETLADEMDADEKR